MSTSTNKYLAYWRDNHKTRPYAIKPAAFAEYEPTNGYGLAPYAKSRGRNFKDVDSDLSRDWNASRVTSPWDRARFAARDVWGRFRTRS